MKNCEILAFSYMAIGTQFFDTVSRENFRKVSDTHGEYLTGEHAGNGQTVYFGQADKFEAKTPIGYQIADADGANMQGDDNDPSGYASYDVMTRERAETVIALYPDSGMQLYAIYPGDIEEPQFVS
jgi:hypothetical protein